MNLTNGDIEQIITASTLYDKIENTKKLKELIVEINKPTDININIKVLLYYIQYLSTYGDNRSTDSIDVTNIVTYRKMSDLLLNKLQISLNQHKKDKLFEFFNSNNLNGCLGFLSDISGLRTFNYHEILVPDTNPFGKVLIYGDYLIFSNMIDFISHHFKYNPFAEVTMSINYKSITQLNRYNKSISSVAECILCIYLRLCCAEEFLNDIEKIIGLK